jgi:hypothetical protein
VDKPKEQRKENQHHLKRNSTHAKADQAILDY